MFKVFVYGTLRTGASNSFRMHGARSLGGAIICGKLFRVHQEFPGIILSEDPQDRIIGEVFTDLSVRHLKELDRYEGCDDSMPGAERIYQRVTCPATLENGEIVQVYVWEYIKSVDDGDYLSSGDWLMSDKG